MIAVLGYLRIGILREEYESIQQIGDAVLQSERAMDDERERGLGQ